MKSGWIINLYSGNRFILNEKAYSNYTRNLQNDPMKDNIKSEEHWFSIEQAKKDNPDLVVIEK